MKIIATICARGGSERLPKKNIRSLAGKPLIVHSIKIAQKSKIFDRIIVSTEDKEIARIARKFGAEVPFLRPQELSQGKVSRWNVIRHAVETLEKNENYYPDIVVDLGAASPIRKIIDIKSCVEILIKKNADIVITGYKADRNPYFNMVELKKGKVSLVKKPKKRVTQGQDAPLVYSMNDSIYAIKRKALQKDALFLNKNICLYEMPRERSIDIDEELDLHIAEFLIRNYKKFFVKK